MGIGRPLTSSLSVAARELHTLWPLTRSPAIAVLILAGIAVAIAAFAVAATTFAFTEPKYLIALCFGLIGGTGLLLAGNGRLLMLYLVVMTAPLKVGLNFVTIGHQGGAGSFLLDAGLPFVLMLAAYQFNDWRKQRIRHYVVPRVAKLWACLIALGLVTVATGSFKTPAAHEVFRMTKYLVLLIVMVNELKRRKQFRHVAIGLLIGVLVQSTFSVASYSAGSQFGLTILGEEEEKNVVELGRATLKGETAIRRPGGLMGHPNQFSTYLALVMPIGVALLFSPINVLWKTIFIGTLFAGQIALLLTLSRTGWACFAVALAGTLALGFLHRSSRRRYFVARAMVIALIAAVGLAASPKILERIHYSDPEAWRARMEFVDDAQRIIEDKPVFGIGLNSYVFVQAGYTRFRTFRAMKEYYGENVPVVHSTWLLTWAEQGTVGIILFVWIHLAVIRTGLRNLKIRDGLLHAMNVGLLSGFCAVMLDGFASFFLRMEVGARIWWLCVAMILAIGEWRRSHEGPARAGYGGRAPSATDEATGNWLAAPARARDADGGWLAR